MTRILTLALLLMVLSGCAGTPPRDEYVLADTAIRAAQAAKAPQYAPGLFTKAQQYYRKAQTDFNNREYSGARTNFNMAREYAEKSENYTMLKKAEDGDAN